jgi:hypothetical protein
MLSSCQNYSRQAEKIVAEVRMREGVAILKNCQKIIKSKDVELEKLNDKLQREVKKSMARMQSGSRGILIGVKAINRAKIQKEKIVKVKAYVEGVVVHVKVIMTKGKATPAEMNIPYDIEMIKKQIKKIEKEFDASESSSTLSTIEESERFLKELQELDAIYNAH